MMVMRKDSDTASTIHHQATSTPTDATRVSSSADTSSPSPLPPSSTLPVIVEEDTFHSISKRLTNRPCFYLLLFLSFLIFIFIVGGITTFPIKVESDFEKYLLTDGHASKRWRQVLAAESAAKEQEDEFQRQSDNDRRRMLLSLQQQQQDEDVTSVFPDIPSTHPVHLTLYYTTNDDSSSSSSNILASPTSLEAIKDFEAKLVSLVREDSSACRTEDEVLSMYEKHSPSSSPNARRQHLHRHAQQCISRRSIVPYFFSEERKDISPPGASTSLLLFDPVTHLQPLPSLKEQRNDTLSSEAFLKGRGGREGPQQWSTVHSYWKQKSIDWFCDNSYSQDDVSPSCKGVRTEFIIHARSQEAYQQFAESVLQPFLSKARQGKGEGGFIASSSLKLHYSGEDGVTSSEINNVVYRDVRLAFASLVFVALYVCFHTRSMLLGIVGMTLVGISFPLAYIMFAWSGPSEMMILNFLGCFVLVAVGADDIFILYDLWRQSRHVAVRRDALAQRYSWTMKKGGKVILATSLTTSVSFFANLASSIGPVREFGWFMGICVLAVCLVIGFCFPLILVWREKRVIQREEKQGEQEGMSKVSVFMMKCMEKCLPESSTSRGGWARRFTPFQDDSTSTTSSTSSPSSSFFGTTYFNFLNKYRHYLTIIGFLVLFISALSIGIGFKAAEGLPQFFPNGNNLQDVQKWRKTFTARGVDDSLGFSKSVIPTTPSPSSSSVTTTGGGEQRALPLVYICKKGFEGQGCDRRVFHCNVNEEKQEDDETTNLCRNNGECAAHTGVCTCLEGWGGIDCGSRMPASPPSSACHSADFFSCNAASGQGLCFIGTCACTNPRYTGSDCSTLRSEVTNDRTYHSFGLIADLSSNIANPPQHLLLDLTLQRATPPSPSSASVDVKEIDATSAWLNTIGREIKNLPEDFSLGATHMELRRYFGLLSASTPSSATQAAVSVGVDESSSASWTEGKITLKVRVTLSAEDKALGMKRSIEASTFTDESSTVRFSNGNYKATKVDIRGVEDAPVRAYAPMQTSPSTSSSSTSQGSRENIQGGTSDASHSTGVVEPAYVQVVWGIKDVRRNGPFGSDYVVTDDKFDITSPEAQLAMLDICNYYNHPVATKDLKIEGASCFIHPFKSWAVARGEEFPIPSTRFNDLAKRFAIASPSWAEDLVFDKAGEKIQWTRATFRTSFSTTSSFEKSRVFASKWENYVKMMTSSFPESMKSVYPTSRAFVRAETQHELISSTALVYFISSLFAVISVFLFTQSFALSALLLLVVVSIVTTLLACMLVILQWNFGVLEAITVIIFIGLSVDYGLHIALSYQQSPSTWDSSKRVQSSLHQSGRSIVGAATTTLGGCLFLFFCVIQMFVKFGAIIFLSTFISLCFSLIFLPALLLLIGPSARRLSFTALLKGKWTSLWKEEDLARAALTDLTLPTESRNADIITESNTAGGMMEIPQMKKASAYVAADTLGKTHNEKTVKTEEGHPPTKPARDIKNIASTSTTGEDTVHPTTTVYDMTTGDLEVEEEVAEQQYVTAPQQIGTEGFGAQREGSTTSTPPPLPRIPSSSSSSNEAQQYGKQQQEE